MYISPHVGWVFQYGPRNLQLRVSSSAPCNVCSNYTTYMCWTQLHLRMHCHILWVSHTSDMNMTCYLHSITLKKAIVYVHSGQEKCLLPHSIIPTKLSFHISDFSYSFTQWVKRLYYHFSIVARPKSTCWEMTTGYICQFKSYHTSFITCLWLSAKAWTIER